MRRSLWIVALSLTMMIGACDDSGESPSDLFEDTQSDHSNVDLNAREDTDPVEDGENIDLSEELDQADQEVDLNLEDIELRDWSDQEDSDEVEQDIKNDEASEDVSETDIAEVTDLDLEDEVETCLCSAEQCGMLDCGAECGACELGLACTDENFCEATCTTSGFDTVVFERAKLKQVGSEHELFYYALDSETAPQNAIVLELSAATLPGGGLHDMAYESFNDCESCFYMLEGLDSTGYDRLLIPVSGQFEVVELAADSDRVAITLHDVIFQEADLQSDYSLEFSDDYFWCVDDFVIDTPSNLTQEHCVTQGTGTELGDNIAELTLYNCEDGTEWNLHDFCESGKAVWLMAVAGWCSSCAARIPDVLDAVDIKTTELIFVLGENSYGGEPTQAYCQAYAESHGVRADRIFIDYDQNFGSWGALYSVLDPYLDNGALLLPWEAVLDSDNMEYYYCSQSTNGFSDPEQAIAEVLSN